MLIVKEV